MKKRSLIILALSAALTIHAQEEAKSPKVVVGVTIDQLRSDYINYFWGAFGEKGFKRIYRKGVLFNNVKYGFPNVDMSSAMATVHTGAYPFIHGVAANMNYDKIKQRLVSCLEDPSFIGNATSETVSPKLLQTTTVGDELKIATNGAAKVFSIGPNLQQAILGAGHIADGAVWLDDYTGKWASTTYYQNYPWYIDSYNTQFPLAKRLEDLSWLPIHEAKAKHQIPFLTKSYPFMHIFSKEDKLKEFILFKTSGLINKEVNEVVYQTLRNGGVGKIENTPDIINISYYAGNYQSKSVREYSLEIKDTYVRLDYEIANLLDSVDKYIGINNTLFYFTSTGYSDIENIDPERYQFSGGDFYPQRCTALLSMFLAATYGNGNWIEGFYNNQIYLNRKLIEEKKLSLEEVQRRSAEFVIQLSGVHDVIPSCNLMHGYFNGEVREARNGYSKRSSGDLLIAIQPGWTVRFEDKNRKDYTAREGAIVFPLIYFGLDLKADTHAREVYVTEIAPTISSFLHIRSPNGAAMKPMVELIANKRNQNEKQ